MFGFQLYTVPYGVFLMPYTSLKNGTKQCNNIEESFAESYSMMRQSFDDETVSRTTTYTSWKRFKDGRKWKVINNLDNPILPFES